ncbi:MAG: polymorphic toxin type 50 domain-containing protein [Waddliaceae bacterium]
MKVCIPWKTKRFLFFLFLYIQLCNHLLFAGRDDGVSIYYYGGIPGCGCFYHCDCFSHHLNGFPDDNIWHPQFPEDKVWHEFMKKFLSAVQAGPYFPNQRYIIEDMVGAENCCRCLCLFSEYLDAIEKLIKRIELARVESIDFYMDLYSKPKDQEKKQAQVKRINDRARNAFNILSSIPETIIPLYKKIIDDCPHHNSYNIVPLYNRGLISLLEGDINGSLEDVGLLIDLSQKNSKQNILNSKIFQRQGESFMEVGLYQEAIGALTNAINRDPKNHEAYFQRASAYFETGDFDQAISDYVHSEFKELNSFSHAPLEFVDEFLASILKGIEATAREFLPSMCHSAYGLSECLWSFCEDPMEATESFVLAAYEMANQVVDYLETLDEYKLKEYAAEFTQFYKKLDHLSEKEKGRFIGFTIGKYGTEIYAGGKGIQWISSCKKLRDANRLCNLEAMATSQVNKKLVSSLALEKYSKRQRFFEGSDIHWGSQNKHVIGSHNYREGSSIFEHKEAEKLLKKYAGTGTPIAGEIGEAGFKELVDFKEHIGVWKNEVGEFLPTTKGKIHYRNDGSAHIVPAHPESKVW